MANPGNRVSTDGKSLELLVSRIYEALKDHPSAKVLRNVKLKNKVSGGLSEFDVIIKTKSMGLDMVTAIECKDYGERVSVSKIRDFQSKCSEVGGIHRKVFVAVNGYQSGAKGIAEHHDVELYDLQEVSTEVVRHWFDLNKVWSPFLDGRHFFYIHFHTADGRTLIFSKADLEPQTPVTEPGGPSFPIGELIQAYAQDYEYAQEQLEYIMEELRKIPINVKDGIPLAVIIPTGIGLGEGESFDILLNDKMEQVRLIEIMVQYTFIVSRSSSPVARSYKDSQNQQVADVLSCQVGPITLEVIRNNSNGQTKFFATDLAGKTTELIRKF